MLRSINGGSERYTLFNRKTMIERTFQNIREGELSDADQQSYLVSLGWSRGATWEALLRSKRVLMISEAGAGKTYECRKETQRLWDAGEPAFFVELAALALTDLRSMLDDEEEARLDVWLSSQSDVATFFLDSIDELKLSHGSFEHALKRLKKVIGSQLGRVRIRHNNAADLVRPAACAPSAAHSSGAFDGAE